MIPLFPLGLVLLPQAELPLHIFEQRYKVMIKECLDKDQVFGIVCFDGKKMHKVGCTARIIRIIKRYRDGRMDLAVKGERRIYVEHIDESREFLQAHILFIDDVDEPAALDSQDLIDKAVNLLKRLDQLLGDTRDYAHLSTLDLKRLSFIIPGSEGFSMEERQRFLELTSSHQRLVKGMQVLESIIARVKISRKVGKIIGGNGQIRALLA